MEYAAWRAGELRSKTAGSNFLAQACGFFRGERPLETFALLQALPIGGDVGPEIYSKSYPVGKPQRVTDDDIRRGEAVRRERIGPGGGGLDGAQPSQEPFGVVGRDLRTAPFFGLQPGIAQYERLRKGQRGVAEIHPVQECAVSRLV